MLKYFLLYSFFIVSTIQCSEEQTYLNHINEMIQNRTHLKMIVAGIADTYAKEPWFEKHKANYERIQAQAEPLTRSLPEIENKLTSYKADRSKRTLCELMGITSHDFIPLHEALSTVNNFCKDIHEEWQLHH